MLCDLQGLTHDAAAHQIGCPTGTIASRLAHGRARLRDRLVRRGLAPAVPMFPALLRPGPVLPALSGALVRAAAKMGAGVPGAETVSAPVRALLIAFWKGMTMRQITLVAALLVLIAVAAAGVALGTRAGAREPRGGLAQETPVPPVNPRTADVLTLPGKTDFDPDEVAKIRTQFDAVVEKVCVGLGEAVKKGDPLLELSSKELADAKKDLQTSYLQWRLDTIKPKSVEIPVQSKAARSELPLRESAASKSRLAFTTARERLVVMGVFEPEIDAMIEEAPGLLTAKPDTQLGAKSRLTRVAPFDGVVIKRDVVVGNYYDRNDTLLVIANGAYLRVWANLPADQRAHVRQGQDCEVEFPYSRSKIPGKIEQIVEQKTPGQPSKLRIRLTVPNSQGHLRADMLVRVKIRP